ncbi:MAG: hypothetical protein H6Q83_2294 [Deltaproteobacteria bacterium]|nr:hypothetical protein [Deltaproteobacteria bacterium]
MSRKLDSAPVAQKKWAGVATPSSAPRALRISSAGIIVAKIPAKRIATSSIGYQVNSFSSRTFAGVFHTETAAAAAMTISLHGTGRKTAPITTISSGRLTFPSSDSGTRVFTAPGAPGGGAPPSVSATVSSASARRSTR